MVDQGVDYVYGLELPPKRSSEKLGDNELFDFEPKASTLLQVCEETWLGIREVALQVVEDR